ncbi:MAG: alpha/beta fold hydrolase [Planctomycetota bacterium]|nr:alpha/beta fold hydrolase [Planctomycetota bacterium]
MIRRAVLLFLFFGTAAAGEIVPEKWLVLKPLDARGRMPFRSDAVFKRYLLDAGAEPPRAGFRVMSGAGEMGEWKEAALSDKGRIEGRLGYAYTSVESPKAQVMMVALRGAGILFVNGAGFVGDLYRLGRAPFPVALRKGTNHVFVAATRGAFSFKLLPPKSDLFVDQDHAIRPDAYPGADAAMPAGVRTWNCTLKALDGVPPLASTVRVVRADPSMRLTVRKKGEAHRRTFVSRIDGTVQEYAVLPPLEGGRGPLGLVLSLHGAGVDCYSQARSYSRKRDFVIVAPTNRGRFGFDWQDWGRRDAYEVLEDALIRFKIDRRNVYLTGHSMGGHGTWHLAANDADGFAAIAPSAGWCSFDTYGQRPPGKYRGLWHAADGTSETPSLRENLAQTPCFILHGKKDDNVPLSEAKRMLDMLTIPGGIVPRVHFQEGAGHWWGGKRSGGADCVDWPGIFDLFRRHRIPDNVEDISFWTVDPGVDADHHWLHVAQPLEYGKRLFVQAQRRGTDGRVTVRTKNVRALRVDVPGPYTVDGQEFEGPQGTWFTRTGDTWKISAAPPVAEKSARRTGPFKRAFDNGFVFVYGTKGTAEENQVLLERARYDAHVWAYRARGHARLVPDTAYDAAGDNNVILYGNADTNGAWAKCLGEGCPVTARRGRIALGGRSFDGDDQAAVFVFPRLGSDRSLVGVFADSGAKGTRLGYTLAPFVSGVGYPDYVVFNAQILDEKDRGILAAGWLNHAWQLE